MFKKNKTLWVIVALVAVVAVVVLILCLRGCGSQTEPDSKTVQTQDSVRTGKVSESDNKTNTKSNSDKAADKSGADKAATDKTADKDTAAKKEESAEQKQGSTSESENQGSTSEEKNSSTSESENYTSISDGNEGSSGESYSEPEPVYTPTPEPVTPVHTHSYTDTVIPPSCTTNGYTVHTCDCGDSYTDSNVSAWGHEWEAVYETRTVEKTVMECHSFCNNCGEDITGHAVQHLKENMAKNGCGGYHEEWVEVPVTVAVRPNSRKT